MDKWTFTEYFLNETKRKRTYITEDLCIKIIENPLKVEKQSNARYRFWGKVEELDNRVVRVITFADKTTIHNAFLDRGYKE
ncbi:MAG: hypothetical protein R3A13_03960 [Bdellovibrionota bacterium]